MTLKWTIILLVLFPAAFLCILAINGSTDIATDQFNNLESPWIEIDSGSIKITTGNISLRQFFRPTPKMPGFKYDGVTWEKIYQQVNSKSILVQYGVSEYRHYFVGFGMINYHSGLEVAGVNDTATTYVVPGWVILIPSIVLSVYTIIKRKPAIGSARGFEVQDTSPKVS